MHEPQTLLVNPVAGAGDALARLSELVEVLEARGPVALVVAATTGELEIAAHRAAAAGHTLIVAGGDGTWNRVVNALNGYAPTLGLLPTGSGNDWCRALGLPTEARAAAAVVARGVPHPVDLIEVNGRRVCTVGGVGLFADTSTLIGQWGAPGARTRRLVRSLGGHAYLIGAAVLLASPARRAQPVQVSGAGPDGAWEWRGSAHAVFVANQQRLGAGLMLPLAARPDDGVCEVGIVPERGRLSLAWKLQALRSGTPVGEDVLIVRRVREAAIAANQPMAFVADGDPQLVAPRLEVHVRAGAVQVLR
jgi:diacylglycerol kinase (ATP)